jgi:hypothetical protein
MLVLTLRSSKEGSTTTVTIQLKVRGGEEVKGGEAKDGGSQGGGEGESGG